MPPSQGSTNGYTSRLFDQNTETTRHSIQHWTWTVWRRFHFAMIDIFVRFGLTNLKNESWFLENFTFSPLSLSQILTCDQKRTTNHEYSSRAIRCCCCCFFDELNYGLFQNVPGVHLTPPLPAAKVAKYEKRARGEVRHVYCAHFGSFWLLVIVLINCKSWGYRWALSHNATSSRLPEYWIILISP